MEQRGLTANVAAKGVSNIAHGGETPVDPVRHEVLRPFGETANVIMEWTKQGLIDVNSTATSNGNYWRQNVLTFRLNSIYDCQVDSPAYTNVTAATADSIGSTLEIPRMRAYWMNFYRYWHVTKTEYQIEFDLHGNAAGTLGSAAAPSAWGSSNAASNLFFSVWTYHHGQQYPPFIEPSSLLPVTDYMRSVHKHCHKSGFQERGYDQLVTGRAINCKISGSFKPGDISNDVAEDEYNEIWHSADEVPPLREYVTFIINPDDKSLGLNANGFSLAASMHYRIRVKYHVQLKDLKAKYQYPTIETDYDSTTDPWKITNP